MDSSDRGKALLELFRQGLAIMGNGKHKPCWATARLTSV